MTVIDINTKEVLYQSNDFPELKLFGVKADWDKYVKDVNEWGKEWEKKLLYGYHVPFSTNRNDIKNIGEWVAWI